MAAVISGAVDYGGCDYGECDYGGFYGECKLRRMCLGLG